MKHTVNTIGFIGAGNMGSAIIARLAGSMPAEKILVFDTEQQRVLALKNKHGITPVKKAGESCSADALVLAVKPDVVPSVLKEIRESLGADTIIVSIAAGVSISSIETILGSDKKIIRIMPNTPSMVGEGMSVITGNKTVTEKDREKIESVFSLIGKVAVLPEKMFDAVTALSGSGPAFVFTFIQALADGGVKMGLPRDKALLLAAQTVLGSATLLMESSEDPITLRSRVASPGGTTIEGIHVLEKSGFSGIVMDAVEAAAVKSKKLGE